MASNTPTGQALRRHLRDKERLDKSDDRGVTKTSLERKIAAAEKAGNVKSWAALRAKQKHRDNPEAAAIKSKTAARKTRKDLVKRGLVVHKPGTLPLTTSYQPMYDAYLDFLHEKNKPTEPLPVRRKRIAQGNLLKRELPARVRIRRAYQERQGLVPPERGTTTP